MISCSSGKFKYCLKNYYHPNIHSNLGETALMIAIQTRTLLIALKFRRKAETFNQLFFKRCFSFPERQQETSSTRSFSENNLISLSFNIRVIITRSCSFLIKSNFK
ncbi:hypothetical protein M0811_06263 [Anaeramoeba ignava]|uniref:Uncharacterized protein n=1 Tax=Anaeramoeba ignava TaxID=1746090 RepID=A0A9Q0LPN6_ANAIG|nr:hypothetical protein M0811_06263 [Anaeramoeba ignava]